MCNCDAGLEARRRRLGASEGLEGDVFAVGRVGVVVGWDQAAKAAGLAQRRKHRSRKGVSQSTAAERFLKANGYLPPRDVVKARLRTSGISTATATPQS